MTQSKIVAVVFGVYLLWATVVIGGIGAAIYVAIHFLHKIW